MSDKTWNSEASKAFGQRILRSVIEQKFPVASAIQFQGTSPEQVAAELGISEPDVAARLTQELERIHEIWVELLKGLSRPFGLTEVLVDLGWVTSHIGLDWDDRKELTRLRDAIREIGEGPDQIHRVVDYLVLTATILNSRTYADETTRKLILEGHSRLGWRLSHCCTDLGISQIHLWKCINSCVQIFSKAC